MTDFRRREDYKKVNATTSNRMSEDCEKRAPPKVDVCGGAAKRRKMPQATVFVEARNGEEKGFGCNRSGLGMKGGEAKLPLIEPPARVERAFVC